MALESGSKTTKAAISDRNNETFKGSASQQTSRVEVCAPRSWLLGNSKWLRSVLFLFLFGLAAAEQVCGQEIETNDIELGLWGGFSPDSPTVFSGLGQTKDRQFFAVAFRFGWVFWTFKDVAVEYVADFYPVAVVTNNPTFVRNNDGTITQTGAGPVYGHGIYPLGLQVHFWRKRRFRVFANSSVGAISFTREMPVPEARTFNYSFDVGGGVQFVTESEWAITIGYKFHHLSNWNTAPRNPGLDANLFYVGFSKFL